MKRIDISVQKPNFIGCWDLENKTLCDEIIAFFENNKNLSKDGVLLLKLNQHSKGLNYIRKGTGFIRFNPDGCKII